jgi:hypothetical protein
MEGVKARRRERERERAEGKKKTLGIFTVSTFPPTTAAPADGDRNEPLGMCTVIGFRQPWFSGISSDMRQRRQ